MKREVLIIDDNEHYRGSIIFNMRKETLFFHEATSPEEGIQIIDKNPQIKVVILDLAFKENNGIAFLEHIKERASDYKVIVLTANENLLPLDKAHLYKIFHFLPKSEHQQAIRFSIEQAFKDIEREALDKKVQLFLDIQEKIEAHRPLGEVLGLICGSIIQLVDGYTCHIRVYDFDRGDFHLAAYSGKASENTRRLFDKPKLTGEFFSGKVVETGKPEIFNSLQQNKDFISFKKKLLDSKDLTRETREYLDAVRSAYIVPISTGLFNTSVDAVLNVSSDSDRFFSDEKQKLIHQFVTQAGLAITKVWLKQKRDELHKDYGKISDLFTDISDKLKGVDVLGGITNVVIKRISEIVNPEVVSVFLFNEKTRKVENIAELRGEEIIENPDEVYDPGESFTGKVYSKGQTIESPSIKGKNQNKPTEDKRWDWRNREKHLKNIPSRRLEHYLGTPIKIGNKTLGVLRAINKKSKYYETERVKSDRLCLLDRGFSEDCRNVLEITASHLAVAIRNAELFKEKDNQVEQLVTLHEVGRSYSSEMKIDELLNLTVENMAKVIKSDVGMLFLKRNGEDRIVLEKCYGMPMIEGAFYKIGSNVTGKVAQTGKPKLIEHARDNNGKYDDEIRRYLMEKHGRKVDIESLMVVPIITQNQTLGVIKVINKETAAKVDYYSHYTEGDLRFFEIFARYVSMAIENSQAYKSMQEKMEAAERNAILSQLVRAVGHEINNTSGLIPVNVQNIRAALPTLGLLEDRGIDESLSLIEDAASQAVDYANELAGFSSTRIGESARHNLNEVIREAIKQIEPDLQKENFANIRLVTRLSNKRIICDIYKTPFIQIVRNIILNAYQAMEKRKKGRLVITSAENSQKNAAVITFENNGPRIKKEHLKKIFEPEFSTKPKGNGLGLWLVKHHLDRMNGTIIVQSAMSMGAKFTIEIPLNNSRESRR